MSKADRIVLALFTIVGVSVSYSFSDQIEKWLQAQQPNVGAFTISIEASMLVVIPIFIFSSLVLRSLNRRSRRKE